MKLEQKFEVVEPNHVNYLEGLKLLMNMQLILQNGVLKF
jgi:hypothetical protein